MIGQSDVNTRLPRYNQAMMLLGSYKRQYEDVVPGQITNYLEQSVPVGMDEHGMVVFPDDYNPEDGPAILMLQHAGETHIRAEGTDRLAKCARTTLGIAGVSRPIDSSELDIDYEMHPTHQMAVIGQEVLWHSDKDDPATLPHSSLVPALIVARPRPPYVQWREFLHEGDHWDFFLNKAPELQQKFPDRTPHYVMRTITEKRAYRTAYDAGVRAHVYSPANLEAIVEYCRTVPPTEFHHALGEVAAGRVRLSCRAIDTSFKARIVSELYADPRYLVSDAEITLYGELGLTS
jgi:hypothetical protein